MLLLYYLWFGFYDRMHSTSTLYFSWYSRHHTARKWSLLLICTLVCNNPAVLARDQTLSLPLGSRGVYLLDHPMNEQTKIKFNRKLLEPFLKRNKSTIAFTAFKPKQVLFRFHTRGKRPLYRRVASTHTKQRNKDYRPAFVHFLVKLLPRFLRKLDCYKLFENSPQYQLIPTIIFRFNFAYSTEFS